MKRKLIATFLSMVLLLTTCFTYSYAVTSGELKNQKKDLEQEQKDNKEKIDEVKDKISDNLQKIQDLDATISDTQDEIAKLNTEIKNLEKEIEEKKEGINQKQEEYEKTDSLLRERLVTMYEAGETTYLDVLFSSEGLMDFISKYYWLTELAECDNQLMDRIEKEKRDIENEKAQIEKDKQKVENNKKSVQTKQTELKVQKAKRETQAAALNEEEKNLQSEIDRITKEIKEVEADILRVAAEEARKAAASGKAPVYTGGALLWPCPGYSRISSYFGSRTSPLIGGSSNHKGIDLAASKGTAILAAEGGTVAKVVNGCSHNYGKSRSCGCGGGYGNYVMISHGGGLVTIYGHCTDIYVSTGQTVSKGQTIATVGSTGSSSGFHLHFGTAMNGVYVDPMNYLK